MDHHSNKQRPTCNGTQLSPSASTPVAVPTSPSATWQTSSSPASLCSELCNHSFYDLEHGITYNIPTSTFGTGQTCLLSVIQRSELCNQSVSLFVTYSMVWPTTPWPVLHATRQTLWPESMVWHTTSWPVHVPQGKHLLNQPLSIVSCAIIHWFSLWPMVCYDLQLSDQYICHKANISTSLSL